MQVSRPNCTSSSPEELKDLEKLKAIIERAIADGKLSKEEMEVIKVAMRADGKITCKELELCQQLIWDKIQQGELNYDWG